MKPRHVLLRIVGLLTLACAVVGCNRGGAAVAELPPPPVTVSNPVLRDVVDYDNYEGRVAAIKKVEIRTRSRGYLLTIGFADGEVVDAGKVLFQVDPDPYEA